MEKISVIVPCYNEEETVDIFYKTFKEEINKYFSDKNDDISFELIFVDDGSTDGTRSKIIKICESLEGFKSDEVFIDKKYIILSRNFGKEASMYAGLKKSSGDFVATMDVDLQDPPSLIREMYNGITVEDYDCVATRRTDRTGDPKLKSWFSNKFYDVINKVSDFKIINGARDFRLMTRKMTDSVILMSERNRFSKGLFSWVGFNTKWLEYKNIERSAGTSKFNFIKLTKYALEGIFGFTDFLLRLPLITAGISAITTVIFLVLGFVYGYPLYFVSSLFSLLFTLLSASMWIMGEYISKIHTESRKRPLFIIADTNMEG